MENISTSKPWDVLSLPNGVYAVNNVWGLSPDEQDPALTTHKIEFDPSEGHVKLSSTIPMSLFEASRVRSYPQVYFGQKDVNFPTTENSGLQRKVKDFKIVSSMLAANFTYTDPVPPLANIAAEIFLHSGPESIITGGDDDSRRFELMVWLQQPGPEISLGAPTKQMQNGLLYTRTNGRFPYAAIVLDPGVAEININWLTLINEMRSVFPNIDFDELYLNSIEFGAEAWAGAFTATITRFGTLVEHNEPEVTTSEPVSGDLDHYFRLLKDQLNYEIGKQDHFIQQLIDLNGKGDLMLMRVDIAKDLQASLEPNDRTKSILDKFIEAVLTDGQT